MIGHNVELVLCHVERRQELQSLYGVLQKLDESGVQIFVHSSGDTIFYPMHRVIRIVDKGRAA